MPPRTANCLHARNGCTWQIAIPALFIEHHGGVEWWSRSCETNRQQRSKNVMAGIRTFRTNTLSSGCISANLPKSSLYWVRHWSLFLCCASEAEQLDSKDILLFAWSAFFSPVLTGAFHIFKKPKFWFKQHVLLMWFFTWWSLCGACRQKWKIQACSGVRKICFTDHVKKKIYQAALTAK